MKRTELATKYEVNQFQMAAILKEAGLKIKKTQVKKYMLVDDTTNETIN